MKLPYKPYKTSEEYKAELLEESAAYIAQSRTEEEKRRNELNEALARISDRGVSIQVSPTFEGGLDVKITIDGAVVFDALNFDGGSDLDYPSE